MALAASSERPTECGHVFVLHCATDNVAADAVLCLPTQRLSTHRGNSRRPRPTIYKAPSLSETEDRTEFIASCVDAAGHFLETAGESFSGSESSYKRAKPLLALPIPGVGNMGSSYLEQGEGTIVSEVLSLAYSASGKFGVDIAICLQDESAYHAAQFLRFRCCPFESGPFWMLNRVMKADIARLQERVEAGRLSIFFGAGVSFPSGLPSWSGLLDEMAECAGFDDATKQQLSDLSFLDQPTLMEGTMGTQFKTAVADCVHEGRYTPAHAMLAALQVPAVTTNYDVLFENAAESTGGDVPVLPWQAAQLAQSDPKRSLMKLHGCIRRPDSIVLTRQDYMRFRDDRQALCGRVQGLLMTTEMMFVGFSMTDDNLHRIIDQCRKVLDTGEGIKFKMGTVLSLVENKVFRRLWDQDFNVISFGKSWSDNPAWKHDCFLDCLVSGIAVKKARSSFLLNPKYTNLLSREECQIVEALAAVAKLRADASIRSSPCWQHVASMLQQLGLPSHGSRS